MEQPEKKSEVLDSVRASLEEIFSGEGVTFSIEPSRFTSVPYRFEMVFPENFGDMKEWQALQSVSKILNENGLELGRPFSAYGPHISYEVNEKLFHGAIHWRRWLVSPENFSAEDIKLLDKVAEFTELQEDIDKAGGDSFEKFDRFLKFAHYKGLITLEEFEKINRQIYKVAH
jgi:hypothetical protein